MNGRNSEVFFVQIQIMIFDVLVVVAEVVVLVVTVASRRDLVIRRHTRRKSSLALVVVVRVSRMLKVITRVTAIQTPRTTAPMSNTFPTDTPDLKYGLESMKHEFESFDYFVGTATNCWVLTVTSVTVRGVSQTP